MVRGEASALLSTGPRAGVPRRAARPSVLTGAPQSVGTADATWQTWPQHPGSRDLPCSGPDHPRGLLAPLSPLQSSLGCLCYARGPQNRRWPPAACRTRNRSSSRSLTPSRPSQPVPPPSSGPRCACAQILLALAAPVPHLMLHAAPAEFPLFSGCQGGPPTLAGLLRFPVP